MASAAVKVVQPLPALETVVPLRTLQEAGARGLSNCLVSHFRRMNSKPSARSSRGFRKSDYWLEAADSVSATVVNDEIVATVRKEGVALNYYGGVVVPKKRKALAVPINPIVGDAWPSERTIKGVFAVKTQAGNLVLAKANEGGGITPLWALVRRTVHRPNKAVLPPPDALADAVTAAAEAALEALS